MKKRNLLNKCGFCSISIYVFAITFLFIFINKNVAAQRVAYSTYQRARPYVNHRVVKIDIRSQDDIEFMKNLNAQLLSRKEHIGINHYVVPPNSLDSLSSSGINFAIVNDNFQELIDRQFEKTLAASEKTKASGTLSATNIPIEYYQNYQLYSSIESRIWQWAISHPALVSVGMIADTYEGRYIYVIRIGYSSNNNKPKVLIVATQHARESLAGMTAMYIGEAAIDGYYNDSNIRSLIDDVELMIIPIVNPDGYVTTWEGGYPFWRKNRHNEGNNCSNTEYSHYGVDLNRNWNDHFGGVDSSGVLCDETYRGSYAFSEMETAGLSTYIENIPSIVFALDVHSYSQLLGWPYSWDDKQTEDEYTFSFIGSQAHNVIEAVHASDEWGYGGWGPIMHTNPYPCSGTMTDWAYSARQLFSYDFEIRPHYSAYSECGCDYNDEPTYDPEWPDDFRPSPTYIIPTGEEMWEAVKYIAERARCMKVIKNQSLSEGTFTGCAIVAGPSVTVSGNIVFEASDYIHLKPGFRANPVSGKKFIARIQ